MMTRMTLKRDRNNSSCRSGSSSNSICSPIEKLVVVVNGERGGEEQAEGAEGAEGQDEMRLRNGK